MSDKKQGKIESFFLKRPGEKDNFKSVTLINEINAVNGVRCKTNLKRASSYLSEAKRLNILIKRRGNNFA